jgi:VCBS repeat-containing protein
VLANDSDPDGDALFAQQVSGPAHGTLTLNANGSFTYTPAPGYSGSDGFSYRAFDGVAYSDAVAVTITVSAVVPTERVTILSATYNARKKQLTVQATSSLQPDATLTVLGYGTMTYKTRTKTYVLTAPAASKPGTVTVTSNRGGSATLAVS